MQSQVSNHSSKGEGLPSQDNTKPHAGIVDKSLLARLDEEKAPLDRISAQVLELSARAYNAFKTANIKTLQQLSDYTENNLLSIRNIGVTTLEEIKDRLNSYLTRMLNRSDWESQITGDSFIKEKQTTPVVQERSPYSLPEAFTRLLEGILTPREGITIRLRYGLDDGMPLTLEEVGQRRKRGQKGKRGLLVEAAKILEKEYRWNYFPDSYTVRRYLDRAEKIWHISTH